MTWVETVSQRLQSLLASNRHELGEDVMRRVFLGTPIAMVDSLECATAEQVVEAADRIGYPVVLKAFVPGLLHKTDDHLVIVGIVDSAHAFLAAEDLLRAARNVQPTSGVCLGVQRQVPGIELAMGIRRDSLGALCVVAAGGVTMELVLDSAAGMAPLSRKRAQAMLRSLRIWPLLDGYRGTSVVDTEQIVDLLVALSDLAVAVPELRELDLNPIIVGRDGPRAVDAGCILAAVPGPSSASNFNSGEAVRCLLSPSRIAVVGGTGAPLSVGSLLIKYLRQHGYSGDLVLINQDGVDADGLSTYRRIVDVPDAVDLACIAVPASRVADVVADCVAARVPSGVIYSAGFAETGPQGSAAQMEVVRAAEGKFRFLGPNSIGVASVSDQVFATFGMALEHAVQPGSIGFVSQSGAVASSLLSRTEEFSIGFSRWLSVGNEADLGVSDCIDYLADDPKSRVICLFLEVVRRPDAFAAACLRARMAGKPILALKAGRSRAGQQAAASHTAAVTGSDVAYEQFLNSCGVIRVSSLSGLFSAAQGILCAGAAGGRRVGLLTMSGGVASILADACELSGLQVPPFSPELQQQLRSVLPSFCNPVNPVDVTAVGIRKPELVRQAFELIRRSGSVDLILVQFTTNADPSASRMAEDLSRARHESGVPFLVGRLGSQQLAPRAMQIYAESAIHVFEWPEDLVEAAVACIRHGEFLKQFPSN